MNTPATLTDSELEALIEREVLPPSMPRYRLLRDVADVDLQAGAIGRIVGERGGDERQFVLMFDCRPGLRVTFYDPEFDARSPEYKLEPL